MKHLVPGRMLTLVLLILISPRLHAGELLQVAVSIIPQKVLVERIGGEHVEVHLMVRPGHSPATYEPTPRQMARLAGTALYYRIGVPFERVWMDSILDAYPKLPVLDARDGVKLRWMEGAGHGEHARGEPDPHIWLSPPRIKIMALRLRDRLIRLDPAHRDDYIKNHAELDGSLDLLDADIRRTLSGMVSRRFMVYHPAWGYFADTYGLQQIPIESEGKEPGARSLAKLLDGARENSVGTIFVQKQFSQTQAKSVAEAIRAKVVVIDSLAGDYPENLRRVARAMAQGL